MDVCIDCHNNPAIPIVIDDKYRYITTHSSAETSTTYGTWAIECKTCHSPHYQKQAVAYPNEGYVETGTGTISLVVSSSVLTDLSKNWTTGAFKGFLLVPNTSNPTAIYRIIGNTATTITVAGEDFADKDSGVNYGLKYGKLIKETIATPNSGIMAVKFFNNEGANSFAAGNTTPVNGVCQICHTKTKSFQNTGTLEANGYHPGSKAGTDCTICHKHTEGFKVTGCDSCHGNPPVSSSFGGPDGLVAVTKGNTGSATPGAHEKHAVTLAYPCDTCHTGGMKGDSNSDDLIQIGFSYLGGMYQSGTYTGRALSNGYGYAAGNEGTTITNTGGLICTNIYCHSNAQGEGGNILTTSYASPAWGDPATVQCGFCHKADGVLGNKSLMDSGSHTKHVKKDSYNMPCSQCHSGAGEGSAVHVNNVINIAIDSIFAGSYSLGNHSPGQGQYGTCSTVYCHSNGMGTYTMPTWGNAGTGACGTCHGVNAAAPPSSERHVKHVGSAAGYQYACSTCHNDVVNTSPNLAADPVPFKDIKLHVNKLKDIAWDATNADGTAYTSAGCSNIYCHSRGRTNSNPYNTADNAPNITPSWTGALDATCTGCHNGDRSAINKMNTGSHSKHVVENDYDCAKCHNETVSNSRTIGNHANHVNKLVNVKFDAAANPSGLASYNESPSPAAKIPGTSFGACKNLYCHSNVQGEGGIATATVYATPVWGDPATVQCGSCHKADGVQGDLTLMDSGSHRAHVKKDSYNMPCSRCHAGAGDGSAAHADSIINVSVDPTFGGSYSLGNHAPGHGQYGSCSTVYCHSNGAGTYTTPAPVWGNAGSVVCGTCHGVNAAAPPSSAAHAKHVGTSAGYRYACSKCHSTAAQPTPDSTTVPVFKDLSLHVNKVRDVSWDATNADGSAYTGPACANIYCHSKGKANSAPYNIAGNTPNITPSWTGALDAACAGCHNGDSSAPNKMDTGTHTKHVVNYDYDCAKCHNETVSNSRTIKNTALHANKQVNIKFDEASNPQNAATYNGTLSPMAKQPGQPSGSCANLYCHSIVQTTTGGPLTPDTSDYKTPAWGGDPTTCASCHGNPSASGAHLKHAGSGTGQYGFTCGQCHSGYVPPGVTTHADGAINTAINAAWGGSYNGDATPGSGFSDCTNTYCHSNAAGGTKNTGGISKSSLLNQLNDPRPVASNTSSAWSTSGPLGCPSCHGAGTVDGRPSYGQDDPKSNSHSFPVPHYQFKCNLCHYVTTHDSVTIFDPSKHGNGIYDVVPDPTNTNGGPVSFTYTYDAGGGKCANVSCHGGDWAYWGSQQRGATYVSASINITSGSGCYEVIANAVSGVGVYYGTPPYTYEWDFGDGNTASGTSSTLPISTPHAYASGGTYNVAFRFRDANYHPGDTATQVTLQSVNVAPAANSAPVSVKSYTVTLTDLSYDPDYNTCGHSGAGKIYVDWGDGTTISQSISLTDNPSNQVYSHTYAMKGTFHLIHKVTDNAGYTAFDPNLITVTVPSTFTISGKITHAGGQPFSGASVDVYTKSGSWVWSGNTDPNGNYTVSNIPDTSEHYDAIPSRSGFTFSPPSIDFYQATVNMNFVGTP